MEGFGLSAESCRGVKVCPGVRAARWVAVSRRVAALAGRVRVVRSIHSGISVASPCKGAHFCMESESLFLNPL